MAGVVALHVVAVLLLLRDAAPMPEAPVVTTLAVFDITPPRPPSPPPPPKPPPTAASRPARIAAPHAGGRPPGPPAVARAPAYAPVPRQITFDATLVTAPPMLTGAAPLPGLVDGGAAGRGEAGTGSGTGRGSGGGSRGGGNESGLGYARANWIEQPSIEEVLQHFPVKAWRAKINGRVLLGCRMSAPGRPDRCETIAETPIGHGFGEAAMELSAFFRIRPVQRGGQTMKDVPIIVPVNFQRRGATMPEPLRCPPSYCSAIPGFRGTPEP